MGQIKMLVSAANSIPLGYGERNWCGLITHLLTVSVTYLWLVNEWVLDWGNVSVTSFL